MCRKNIILIGYGASGKSTIGKKLSQELNFTFLDIDDIIKAEIQNTNPYLERLIESCAFSNSLKDFRVVISPGGGVFTNNYFGEVNRNYLINSNSYLIYLQPHRDLFEATRIILQRKVIRDKKIFNQENYDIYLKEIMERHPIYLSTKPDLIIYQNDFDDYVLNQVNFILEDF